MVAVVVGLALAALVWAAGRWLTAAWEVLDDDQLAAKLDAPGVQRSPALWFLVRGWFAGGPRRLTYRRDERGRFRRVRR